MSIQSARNNLTKAKSFRVRNAERACFYLKRLHEETGKSEQFIMAEMIVKGLKIIPEYKEFCKQLEADYELQTV